MKNDIDLHGYSFNIIVNNKEYAFLCDLLESQFLFYPVRTSKEPSSIHFKFTKKHNEENIKDEAKRILNLIAFL